MATGSLERKDSKTIFGKKKINTKIRDFACAFSVLSFPLCLRSIYLFFSPNDGQRLQFHGQFGCIQLHQRGSHISSEHTSFRFDFFSHTVYAFNYSCMAPRTSFLSFALADLLQERLCFAFQGRFRKHSPSPLNIPITVLHIYFG